MAKRLVMLAKPGLVAVVGRATAPIVRTLRQHGFYIVKRRPELVVSFGGDGTLLHSERLYQGVPKIAVRHDWACPSCKDNRGSFHPVEGRAALFHCLKCFPRLAAALARQPKMAVEEHVKAEASAYSKGGRGKGSFIAVNEATVRAKRPQQALRGSVSIGAKAAVPWFVGDGVLVATPFGSTGYFYSCTRTTFSKGLGVAVINPTRPTRPITVRGRQPVRITITRRHGLFYCDNSPTTVTLDEGDYVLVKPSRHVLRLVRAHNA